MTKRPDAAPPKEVLLCRWCRLEKRHHVGTQCPQRFYEAPPSDAAPVAWHLRPLTDLEDDGGDYLDFATLLYDLCMDAKEHPATVNRYEWYHEQIGKLLSRMIAHPEDAPGGPYCTHHDVGQDEDESEWYVQNMKNGTIEFTGTEQQCDGVRNALNKVDRLKGDET